MTPIFLMSHNNYKELKLCVKSILNRTYLPYKIFIVDNNSKEKKTRSYLIEISNNPNVEVYQCDFNIWILSLNKPLKKVLTKQTPFIVTDSDIIVPLPQNNKCWLERMLLEFKKHPSIGKLGLSIDLGYIKNKKQFTATYYREINYKKGTKIGTNIIAPVDTTLALYRYDFFVTRFPFFVPGHGVLGKPQYLTCRTRASFLCKHVGWRSYLKPNDSKYTTQKYWCFTFLGGYLDTSFLRLLPFPYKILYSIARPIIRFFWGILVITLLLIWFLKNAPRSLNTIGK